MALRKSTRTAATRSAEQSDHPQELTVNPDIDKRIEEFIQNNPKQFEYYNSLPKERLVRVAILKDIPSQDRSERSRSAILRKLDSDPEMKKSVETLVRNMPEERKRTATANIPPRVSQARTREAQHKSGSGASIARRP